MFLFSLFQNIIDRVLFSQYLVKRFAYGSFLQVGGCNFDKIYSLLPESMPIRTCLSYNHVSSKTQQAVSPFEYLSKSTTKYGVILIEPEKDTEDPKLIVDAALVALEDGGTIILVNTNPTSVTHKTNQVQGPYLWDIAVYLRSRAGLDVATLDADGGITIVRRSNGVSIPASSGTVPSALNPIEGSTPQPPVRWTDHQARVEKESILRLMSFEEIHDWLAPTGHVDAVTAFGGEKAVELWLDMRKKRLECSKYLSSAEILPLTTAVSTSPNALPVPIPATMTGSFPMSSTSDEMTTLSEKATQCFNGKNHNHIYTNLNERELRMITVIIRIASIFNHDYSFYFSHSLFMSLDVIRFVIIW